jgi:hypothetical protein
MKIAESYFEKIIVIVPKEQYQAFEHYLSPNIIVYQWSFKRNFKLIWNSLPFVFSKTTFNEIFGTGKRTKIKNRLKIAFNDVFKSSYLMNEVQAILTKEQINPKESVFYSYWHDYKALALARLKGKIKELLFQEHTPPIFLHLDPLSIIYHIKDLFFQIWIKLTVYLILEKRSLRHISRKKILKKFQ